MTTPIVVGLLVAGGTYLLLQRGMLRVVVGFVLLGHAANLLLLAAGGPALRGVPFAQEGLDEGTADPLPQAFVLTAIVIAFAITVYLLGLLRAGRPGPEDGGGTPPPGEEDAAAARGGRGSHRADHRGDPEAEGWT
ncbi:sodium:proton antiporter [Kineococcus terrestris]|uniref:sodium:proton antiporter n=1 Tax=Kineococcus terrestris TaxID=2044856 RepID=UPI0034DAC521